MYATAGPVLGHPDTPQQEGIYPSLRVSIDSIMLKNHGNHTPTISSLAHLGVSSPATHTVWR
jgi:hypothetical protein